MSDEMTGTAPARNPLWAPETEAEIQARNVRFIKATKPAQWLRFAANRLPEPTSHACDVWAALFAIRPVGPINRRHEQIGAEMMFFAEGDFAPPGGTPLNFQGCKAVSGVHLPGSGGDKMGAARAGADTDLFKKAVIYWSGQKSYCAEDFAAAGFNVNDVPIKERKEREEGGGAPAGASSQQSGPPPAGLARAQGESAKDHCWRAFNACKASGEWGPWNAASNSVLPKGAKLKDATPDQLNAISAALGGAATAPPDQSQGAGWGPPPAPMTDPQREQLAKLSSALGLTPQAKGDLLRACGHAGGAMTEGVANVAIRTLRAELESRGVDPDTGEITPVDPPF